jgi:hypothetical protein
MPVKKRGSQTRRKCMKGGTTTSEHGIAVYGGPGQQTTEPGSNVIHQNTPVVASSNQSGGKKHKKRTMKKRKTMKKNEGYCLKCKKYRMMKDPKEATIKNGRSVLKGECMVCSTNMMKFI